MRLTCMPAMLQSLQQERAVLAEVGEGGYGVRDFEILQQLGRLSWVRKR